MTYILGAQPSRAQLTQPEDAMEETVVVASRAPDLIDQVGVSVSVLNRDAMRALGYPDLGSLLDTQPGVTVTMDGGYGKAAAVRIRGEEGYRTRIVLDGINIADPSSPQISPRVEHLLSSGLTRVEILRGPQGLMWGADAGGVILMSTTDERSKTGLEGFLEAGGDDFYQGALSGVIATDHLQASLSLGQLETDGINARDIDAISADRDGYENTTAHGAMTYRVNEAISLEIAATDISGENEYDGCYDIVTFALIHDCEDQYQQQAWRLGTQLSFEAHNVSLSVASSDTERAFFSAGQRSYDTRGETDTFSLIGTWRPTESTRLTYGIDQEEQSLSDGSTDWSRDNTGLYLEAQQKVGAGIVTVGWRRDDNDDFGEHDSWRLSGRLGLTGFAEAWAIRAATGTGFRAPSLYEIAYNNGPFSYPPASGTALLEERSKGWELGLIGQLGTLELEIIWFDQEIENEIVFDLASYSGYLQSTGTSKSEGVEVVGSLPLSPNWLIEGNLTWMDATQQTGGDRPYRPEQTARLSLLWQRDDWSANLTARHTGEATDPFLTKIDNTFTLDLTARWSVTPTLSLEARVLNLTDNTDQQLPGYRVPGTTAFLGARISL
jgi:vitamin B12 transporter